MFMILPQYCNIVCVPVCACVCVCLCVYLCVCVCVPSGSRLLQPAQVCDVMKGVILLLCYSMMHYVDYSMMYHMIRGQSVIKLYIIYNMLEVRGLHYQ